jgi:hypothetical protein
MNKIFHQFLFAVVLASALFGTVQAMEKAIVREPYQCIYACFPYGEICDGTWCYCGYVRTTCATWCAIGCP